MILEYDKALEILKKYNQDDFHIRHGEVVSGVMRYFAKEYDPERRFLGNSGTTSRYRF